MGEILAVVSGDLEPWALGLVLAAAFLTGVFHTYSGFAGGALLSVVLAPILGIAAIVPVLAIGLVVSATSRMWVFRRHLDIPRFLNVMVPAVPGIIAGAVIYTGLSAAAIAILLGAVLLSSAALRRRLASKGRPVTRTGLAVAGSAFGFLSGMTLGAGMILIPFLIGAGLQRERLAAVVAGIGFSLNLTKSAVFIATASIDTHLAALGLAIGLCTIPGTWLGYRLLRATSMRLHTFFVESLVLAAGLGFVAHGLFTL